MKRFRVISAAVLAVILTVVFSAAPVFAKKLDDTVLDGALNIIKNNATILTFCTQEPAAYANVVTYCIVTKTGLASGSFTVADDTSGRKVTVAAQTTMTPSANGTVTHACLVNGTTLSNGSVLYGCTTTTSQAVTTSQTWDSPAFKFAIADPS